MQDSMIAQSLLIIPLLALLARHVQAQDIVLVNAPPPLPPISPSPPPPPPPPAGPPPPPAVCRPVAGKLNWRVDLADAVVDVNATIAVETLVTNGVTTVTGFVQTKGNGLSSITAIDMVSGAVKWHQQTAFLDNTQHIKGLAVGGGRVYGTVYNIYTSIYSSWALDSLTGALVWWRTWEAGWFYVLPPVYHGSGTLVVYSAQNIKSARGLLASSGAVLWETVFSATATFVDTPYQYLRAQVMGPNVLIPGTGPYQSSGTNGAILALNALTGSVAWLAIISPNLPYEITEFHVAEGLAFTQNKAYTDAGVLKYAFSQPLGAVVTRAVVKDGVFYQVHAIPGFSDYYAMQVIDLVRGQNPASDPILDAPTDRAEYRLTPQALAISGCWALTLGCSETLNLISANQKDSGTDLGYVTWGKVLLGVEAVVSQMYLKDDAASGTTTVTFIAKQSSTFGRAVFQYTLSQGVAMLPPPPPAPPPPSAAERASAGGLLLSLLAVLLVAALWS